MKYYDDPVGAPEITNRSSIFPQGTILGNS